MTTGTYPARVRAASASCRSAPSSCGTTPGDAVGIWDVGVGLRVGATLLLLLAGASPVPPGPSVRPLRLSEIPQHILRVSCSRCARIVEIQKADAVRLYGQTAVWKDVGQRLLEDTCQVRTGRHEEDGCWPSFE